MENENDKSKPSTSPPTTDGEVSPTTLCSAFSAPSEFMLTMKKWPEIEAMDTREIASLSAYEIWNNGALNWKDDDPENCWYRALAVELGRRVYSLLSPQTWADWEDNVACWLSGVAGYDDHSCFAPGACFGVSAEDFENLDKFLQNV